MNPNVPIPEEIQAMAALIGQSSVIDSMMVQRPSTLATSTQTLKQGLNEYVQQQRQQMVQPPPQVALPTHPVQYPQVPMPPIEHIPNYRPPQMGMNMYPTAADSEKDDGQLEFNLEPSKVDIIINLLKEISLKLTKQNNMLEKQYANQSKEKRISDAPIKLRTNP